MPSPATAEHSLTYGATTIGGSSPKYHLHGPYRLDLSNLRGVLEVDVMVTAAGAADFATFEQAFRVPRQTVTFTYLGVAVVEWDHEDLEGGVNTEASIRRPGTQEADAGLGGLYTIRIEADLVPDGPDQGGLALLESVVSRNEQGEYSARFSGIYIGDDYDTAVDAYVEAVRTRHSITRWDLIEESITEDVDAAKRTWSRTYAQVLLTDGSVGGLRGLRSVVTRDQNDERTLDLEGVYTGLYANYGTAVASYVATVLARHSITGYDLLEEQREEDHDAGITRWRRRYREIMIEDTATTGLRDLLSVLRYDESRVASVEIAGVWVGAIADYEDSVDAYAATVLARHSITAADLLSESREEDHDAQRTRFSRQYRQIPSDQSAAGLDHESVVNPSIVITRALEAPGDYQGTGLVRRLVDVAVVFNAAIDISQVDDLQGFYRTVIRPFLVSKARTAIGAGQIALVGERASWDDHLLRLDATLSLKASNGSQVVAHSYTRSTVLEFGGRVVPIWAASAFAGEVAQGPASYLVTETWVRTRIGASLPREPLKGGTGGGVVGGGAGSGGPRDQTIVGGRDLLSFGGGGTSSFGGGSLGVPFVQGAQSGGLLGAGGGGRQAFGVVSGLTISRSGAQAGSRVGGTAGVAPGRPDGSRPSTPLVLRHSLDESPSTLGLDIRLDLIDEREVLVTQWYDPVGPVAGPQREQTTDVGRNA